MSDLINAALPQIKLWVDTDKKVSKITHRTFKKLVKGKRNLEIREEMLSPIKEEAYQVIGDVLLYMDQHPESKLTKELEKISGFNEMLTNIANS